MNVASVLPLPCPEAELADGAEVRAAAEKQPGEERGAAGAHQGGQEQLVAVAPRVFAVVQVKGRLVFVFVLICLQGIIVRVAVPMRGVLCCGLRANRCVRGQQ